MMFSRSFFILTLPLLKNDGAGNSIFIDNIKVKISLFLTKIRFPYKLTY